MMYLENYVHVYMVMLVTEIVFFKNIFSLPVSPGENTGYANCVLLRFIFLNM